MPIVVALLAGTLFGAGLMVSDMVNPARILNFLDVAGSWDPSLLFVMAGALAATFIGYRLVLARARPAHASRFHLPETTAIDAPLMAGAALFGVGWGIAGFCPGPAIAALVTLQPKVLLFVVAMAAGMVAARIILDAFSQPHKP